jgi:hypothetical protein
MTSLEVSVTVGDKRPITVAPTAVDVTPYSGPGYLAGWSLRDVATDVTVDVSGNVVAPGAAATIATTAALPAGTYTVTWEVGLQGAAAAADSNNFQLVTTAGPVLASVNPGAAGAYPQPSTEVTVLAGQTVSIKSIGAGTAGVTYSAALSLDPTGQIETIVEVQDGNGILGEVSFQLSRTASSDFGEPGILLAGQVTLHVVSGKVTGAIYIVSDQYNG